MLARLAQGSRAAFHKRALVLTAIDELLAHATARRADRGVRSHVPSRSVAIVTCMDTRIDVYGIFGLAPGEAHIVRNAGGIVTEDVLRSLVLSQRSMQTREVLLMHHTRCGLHGADEAAFRREIAATTGRELPYALGAFDDVDVAVREAMRRVRDHPFLVHVDRVRGFVYDVESGRLHEVGD
ncbi:MAG: carbonic anhydrase [Vulcanimicrobiaceae bacterium]